MRKFLKNMVIFLTIAAVVSFAVGCSSTSSSNNGGTTGKIKSREEALSFISGDWFTLDMKERYGDFIQLSFDYNENTIKYSTYTVNPPVEEDDKSSSNIYFENKIYTIRGGGTRRGTITITDSGNNVYLFDIYYPVNSQYPTEDRTKYEVTPDFENDLLRIKNEDGSEYVYQRGDVDDLRTYYENPYKDKNQ